ncbi:hypothetical protein LJC61_05050 [Ruminococcaceae bacterium OttesenSCG-928-A16]|nr:hypothetical protein [Ruminococcaceae bacterium OttesenSCG-928-A16]
MKKLLLALLVLSLLSACSAAPGPSSISAELPTLTVPQTSSTAPASATSNSQPVSAEFIAGPLGTEILTLSVGDTFAGMELTSLDVRKEYNDPDFITFLSAEFVGDVALYGQFYISENEMDAGSGYLVLDEESLSKIPVSTVWLPFLDNPSMSFRSLPFANSAEDIQKITNLSESDGISCEIIMEAYYVLFIADSGARDIAIMKTFTPL